jgi:hypothetical protein
MARTLEDSMCYEFEREYHRQRAEEARRELEKSRQREQPKPAAPAQPPGVKEGEPVPA